MVVWHCLSFTEAVHWSGNGRQSRFLFFMLGKRNRRAREQYFLWGYALTDLKPFIGSDSLKLSTMFQCCHTKDQTLAYGPLETIPDPKYNTQDVCICFYLTLTIQICSPFPELGLSVGPSQHPSHLWSPEHRLGVGVRGLSYGLRATESPWDKAATGCPERCVLLWMPVTIRHVSSQSHCSQFELGGDSTPALFSLLEKTNYGIFLSTWIRSKCYI